MCERVNDALEALNYFQTSGQVKYGHWIENHYEFYVLDENYKPVLLNGIGYKCNICNKDNEKTTDYCPHCGAKMDGGEDK